jgi:hypothetical protein
LRLDSSVKTAEMLAMYTFYQFYAPVFSEFVRNPGEAYKYRGLVCSQLGYEYRAASDLNKAAQIEQELKNRGATRRVRSPRYVSKPRPLLERFCQKIKKILRLNRRWR